MMKPAGASPSLKEMSGFTCDDGARFAVKLFGVACGTIAACAERKISGPDVRTRAAPGRWRGRSRAAVALRVAAR